MNSREILVRAPECQRGDCISIGVARVTHGIVIIRNFVPVNRTNTDAA
jgi:hypothetical protein